MAGTTASTSKAYATAMSEALGTLDHAAIDRYADLLFEAWRDGRQVFVFGNGGSAYNSSHHVTDYVKTASVQGKKRLHAFSLTDNVGLSTAVGNDLSYDQIFSYPLESYAKKGDVAVGISCSGNSPNLLTACSWAKQNGLIVVALTGFSGGKVKDLADLHLNVASSNYGVIEDLHMSIGHIAAQRMQQRIMNEAGTR